MVSASELCFEGGVMARFLDLDDLFKGRHFDREVIILCVRRYLRFKLSFRNLVKMIEERGLSMAHTTIMRWVHHYSPEFLLQKVATNSMVDCDFAWTWNPSVKAPNDFEAEGYLAFSSRVLGSADLDPIINGISDNLSLGYRRCRRISI